MTDLPPVQQKLQSAVTEIPGLIRDGDTAKAFQKISAFQGDASVTRFTVIRVLVSTGQHNQDRAVLTSALDVFERLKAKAKRPLGPESYYDIANGYLELFALDLRDDGTNIFDREQTVMAALRYGERGAAAGPRALTNLGNLYDQTGRPVEALRCYERALAIDPEFGMALGNKAMAIQTLAPITRYTVTHLIQAHQLYQAAIQRAESVAEAGLDGSLESFRNYDEAIVGYLASIGRADRLDHDLRDEPYDDSALSEFVRFYTRFCLEHKENQKRGTHPTARAHLSTNQRLDQWSRPGSGATASTAAPVEGSSIRLLAARLGGDSTAIGARRNSEAAGVALVWVVTGAPSSEQPKTLSTGARQPPPCCVRSALGDDQITAG